MKTTLVLLVLALAMGSWWNVTGGPTVGATTDTSSPAPAVGSDARSAFRAEHNDRDRDPISVTLELLGAPEVGTSTLRATVEAAWDGFSGARAHVEGPVQVATDPPERVLDLRPGVPVSTDFSVTFLEPGTHLLKLRIHAASERGPVGGYRQGYAVVPETGEGRFYGDSLPETWYARPAVPYTGPRPVVSPPAPELASILASMAPRPIESRPLPLPPNIPPAPLDPGTPEAASTTFRVTGCWGYTDEEDNFQPQRWVAWEVWDRDSGSDDDVLAGGSGVYTDYDGCFTSGNIPRAESDCCGNQDVYVKYWTCNWFAVCAGPALTNFYVFVSAVSTVGDEDLVDFGTLWPGEGGGDVTRFVQYANNGWYFAVFNAGMPSSQITRVRVVQGTNCTFYRTSEDAIYACNNGIDDKSPDDIGHEYGHFVMDKLYNDAYWPGPGGSHTLCADNQNRGLSWSEGWADFFGPRMNNEVNEPGANGDALYNRPWDGSIFSEGMESDPCGVTGDDQEMNVARALWDVRDSSHDGVDESSDTLASIFDVVNNCNDATYQDYYNLGCGWVSRGRSACNFVRSAFQNDIDYNNVPSASVTSQASNRWVRGTAAINGTGSDPEGCPLAQMVFRASGDGTCEDTDVSAGSDATSPYSVDWDTTNIADDATVWTCGKSDDGMELGGYARSASSIGVDNTAPTGDLSPPPLALFEGYDVPWTVADATSGLAGVVEVQERNTLLAEPFATVCSQAAGGATAAGTCARQPTLPGSYCYRLVVSDVAGNTLTSAELRCTLFI